MAIGQGKANLGFVTLPGLAEASPEKVGFTAWRLALAAFIVLYMFVYGPELLLLGSTREAVVPFIISLIGCLLLTIALEGFFLKRVDIFTRWNLGIAAAMFIEISLLTDLIGLGMVVIVLVFHIIKKKVYKKGEEE